MKILKFKELPFASHSEERHYYSVDRDLFVWKQGVALVKAYNNQTMLIRFENLCSPITNKESLIKAEELLRREYAVDKNLCDHMERISWDGEWLTAFTYAPIFSMALNMIKGLKINGIKIPQQQQNFISDIDVVKMKMGPLLYDWKTEGNPLNHAHIALIKDWNSNELKFIKFHFSAKQPDKDNIQTLLTETGNKVQQYADYTRTFRERGEKNNVHWICTRYHLFKAEYEILKEYANDII